MTGFLPEKQGVFSDQELVNNGKVAERYESIQRLLVGMKPHEQQAIILALIDDHNGNANNVFE